MVRLSTVAAVLAAIIVLILSPVALAQPGQQTAEQVEAARAAVDWLLEQQNADGGFTSFSAGRDQAPSDIGGTVDAILALAAAGSVSPAGGDGNPISYLMAHPEDLQTYAETNPGQAGKAAMALAAAGQNPRAFGGVDLVSILVEQAGEAAILEDRTPIEVSYALLGLAAAGDPAPQAAVDWLLARQAAQGDFVGAWDDGFGTAANVDATALALMALVASGTPAGGDPIGSALEFLQSAQLPSAEWPYAPDLPGNANSTALAIQALAALGEDFSSQDSPWSQDGATPIDALLTWQAAGGAFQADLGQGREDSFFATVQAMPALLGEAYPLSGEAVSDPPDEAAAEATPAAAPAGAEDARAGLVVVLGEEDVLTRCVAFPEASITGQELLDRSGLNVETQVQGAGALTCQIEGVGCPADDCFCQCESGGADCNYWSYWQQQEGEWQYAVAGATQTQVTNGAVEGWVWGSGAAGEAPAPPPITIADICPAGASPPDSGPEAGLEPVDASSDEAVAGQPGAANDTPASRPDWIAYSAFIAIAVALGLLAWIVRRRSQGA